MTHRTPGKPTKGARILSTHATEIRYIHDVDGDRYKHPFAKGVTIELLPDGSARLYRPDGKPLWRDF